MVYPGEEIRLTVPNLTMEISPGVLYYKISEYAGINSIPVMELLNTTIRNKLKTNSSAFIYQLRKK